ncbi:polysaccharide pyruvyl transferase family protein [bacterium]|nr:polysaccharide pyruvyl transferase family protein [bacterium]
MGIIPHWTHINDEILNKFKNNDNIIIINFNTYDNWQTIIKQILSCDFIVSESLHGLIISDTYKIPNYYVSFGELKQDFKYEDYFLSIGKTPYKSYQITNNTTINDLLNL